MDINTASYQAEHLQEMAEQVLQQALTQGATQAAVAIDAGQGMELSVRMQKTDAVEYHQDQGLSLTVYCGQRKGTVSITDFQEDAILRAISAACDIATYTEEDDCAGLPDVDNLATSWPELDLNHPWDLSVEEGLALAKNCEQIGLDADPAIRNSDGASVSTYQGLRVFANSHGFNQAFASARHSLSLGLIAEKNGQMERDYEYCSARAHEDLWSIDSIARSAAKKTLERLNPKPVGTQKVPVIFLAPVATSLINHFVGAVSGGNLYRQTTFLLDAKGQQIFPEWFSIHENPFIPRGMASCPYDAEGVAVSARELVAQGVVQGYLLSSYTARKLGLTTTGNAGGAHNLRVSHNQSGGLAALVKQLDKGLIVTDLMGQGINMITGDYSRGATGLWVEGGQIQHAVSEVTIASTLQQMYQNIQSIGDDIETRGHIQVGSVLIGEMTVASA